MFNVTHLIEVGGLLALFLIIFSESGMMVGFFFPGDTLLFTSGILAASGRLPALEVILVVAFAAILGDNVGYHIGRSFGRRLFSKPDSFIFRKAYIERAEKFYEKYGSKTMLLAHFVPIVRTFAPVTAGAGNMPLKKFMLYDAIGDTAWAVAVILAGYFIGSRIPGIENLLEPILLLVVVVSLGPTIYHLARDPKVRQAVDKLFRRS
ncbi:MAG TPA: VTT domain-containing protein [Verrucomicrobiae bacterium]|nr:VTT domain-containing protein [Verrucomicrobiae bacterium]